MAMVDSLAFPFHVTVWLVNTGMCIHEQYTTVTRYTDENTVGEFRKVMTI